MMSPLAWRAGGCLTHRGRGGQTNQIALQVVDDAGRKVLGRRLTHRALARPGDRPFGSGFDDGQREAHHGARGVGGSEHLVPPGAHHEVGVALAARELGHRRHLAPHRGHLPELGPARDLDVFGADVLRPLRAKLPADPAIAASHRQFEEKRIAAYARAAAGARSLRFRAAMLDLAEWIETGPWSEDDDKERKALRTRPVAEHAKVFEHIASQNAEGALREMAFLIDAALADTIAVVERARPGPISRAASG